MAGKRVAVTITVGLAPVGLYALGRVTDPLLAYFVFIGMLVATMVWSYPGWERR